MTEKNPFFGATFAERKAAREAAEKTEKKPAAKQVDADEVEDKAVSSASTKKRAAKKKG